MAPLINVHGLRKVYTGDRVATVALDGVSFVIAQGEFVALMGPSGSGKSTLLHILGFLDRPSGGVYQFEGRSMDEYRDDELAVIRNKKMGFVFQAFNLLPRTTVFQNVKLPLVYGEVAEEEQEERARAAIEAVGLSARTAHEPSELSGGEKQRVAIARALVMQPAVIFADEPTGNLDSASGTQVMQYLATLHEAGHTVVLITHETYTAEFAARIIRLKDGRVVSDERVLERRNGQLIK